MNYIHEINSFYNWLESNQLPKNAIALWHALMAVNNKTGWKKEFTVALSSLAFRTGFSVKEVVRGRKILTNMGRIKSVKQGSKKSAVYTIYSFEEQNIMDSTDKPEGQKTFSKRLANSGAECTAKSTSNGGSKGYETGHINKQNKTKQNKTISLSNDNKLSLVINKIDDANSNFKISKRKSGFDLKNENFEALPDAEGNFDNNSENEIQILTGGGGARTASKG